jgi:hypothetical protein
MITRSTVLSIVAQMWIGSGSFWHLAGLAASRVIYFVWLIDNFMQQSLPWALARLAAWKLSAAQGSTTTKATFTLHFDSFSAALYWYLKTSLCHLSSSASLE